MTCECSKLDWSEVDQTAEHHPLCGVSAIPLAPAAYLRALDAEEEVLAHVVEMKAPVVAKQYGLGDLVAINSYALCIEGGIEVDLTPVSEWLGGVNGLKNVTVFSEYVTLTRKDGLKVSYDRQTKTFSLPWDAPGSVQWPNRMFLSDCKTVEGPQPSEPQSADRDSLAGGMYCVTVILDLADGSQRTVVTEVSLPAKVKNGRLMVTRGKDPIPFDRPLGGKLVS